MSRSAKAPRRRGQRNHMFKVGYRPEQGRLGRRLRYLGLRAPPETAPLHPTTRKGGYHNSPNSDICNWRKK